MKAGALVRWTLADDYVGKTLWYYDMLGTLLNDASYWDEHHVLYPNGEILRLPREDGWGGKLQEIDW